LNRIELHQLAEDRILDAQALLDAGRWSGAYYLCGYAIECALKACIAKRINQHDFPDKELALNSFTHSVSKLADVAGLRDDLDKSHAANPAMRDHWQRIKDWNEKSRYKQSTEVTARLLYESVTDPTNGVLSWIRARW
jgi:hypothetical protein